MIRAGIPEKQIMLIAGWKTRNLFDRYHIIDEPTSMRRGKGSLDILKGRAKFCPKSPSAHSKVVTEIVTKKNWKPNRNLKS